MAKAYVLYNPLAGNGKCADEVKLIEKHIKGDEIIYSDVTKSEAVSNILAKAMDDDYIVIAGGDGTLNRFVNDNDVESIKNDILYFPCGTGNDFALDIEKSRGDKPLSIKKHLVDLPEVEVKGKTYKFINGVGYGIDGYCCEVGDELRAKNDGKKIDYTAIAIKGLLFHYKPTGATITVDGVTKYYKKAWLAPTMNGRFYGGGMLPAPGQRRDREDKKLSVMVFHGSGKLKTLMIFPSIFKGEHVKKVKHIEVLEGHEITVKFDEPRALQVDGETILGVTECTSKAKVKVNA